MQSMPFSDVLAGGLVGLLVFLPFYAVSAMGAGDIKLMSVVGTFVGVKGVLVCALFTALTGGGLALVFALSRARNQLPYALAILAGVATYVIVSLVNPAFLNLSLQGL
jgi:prepilin peptidase CpaA